MIDLTNQRIGRLVMLERLPGSKWCCSCDCGNTVVVAQQHLRRKKATRSCGCLTGLGSLPPGTAALNALFSAYKAKAKKRGYTFALSLEEFKVLTSQTCFYCGVEPKQVRRQGTCPTVYIYNGVDRKENQLGYVPVNCVSCCGICNQAKSDLSYDEFVAWLKRVHSHLNLGAKTAISTP